MDNQITLCKHPCTTVIVDDSIELLDNMELFVSDITTVGKFSVPQRAIDHMNTHASSPLWSQRCISSDSTEAGRQHISVDLSSIHKTVYNPERFKDIALVIFDYSFPEGIGVDYLRQIENQCLCKLLFTAEQDVNIALEAFNNQEIDRYVQKHQKDCDTAVLDLINELQLLFFLKESKNILNIHAQTSHINLSQILSNPNVIKTFNAIFKENETQEHYILDTHGSTLILDEDANAKIIAVVSQQQLDEAANHIEDSKLANKLKNHESLLFNYNETNSEDLYKSPNLANFIYPATPIANTDLYYAVIENVDEQGIKTDKIKSYGEYLDELDY